MFPVASILWPTDTSESSLTALETAVEVAQKFNTVLYPLRGDQQIPPRVTGLEFAAMAIKGFDVPLYQQELLQNAENDLQRVVARKIPKRIKGHSEGRIGIIADVINAFTPEKNIDLIVMAAHGRTGFSRFMIGSVAEKIVCLSTRPTLIIPGRRDDTSV
jgi:nucleotide-binding universal stress UspA family protein